MGRNLEDILKKFLAQGGRHLTKDESEHVMRKFVDAADETVALISLDSGLFEDMFLDCRAAYVGFGLGTGETKTVQAAAEAMKDCPVGCLDRIDDILVCVSGDVSLQDVITGVNSVKGMVTGSANLFFGTIITDEPENEAEISVLMAYKTVKT